MNHGLQAFSVRGLGEEGAAGGRLGPTKDRDLTKDGRSAGFLGTWPAWLGCSRGQSPCLGGGGVRVGVGSRGEEQSHARRLRERSWQPGRRLVYFFMEVNNPVAFQRGAWPPPPVPGECHGPMQPLPPEAAAHGPRAACRPWPCTLWAPGHGALASSGPLASWP